MRRSLAEVEGQVQGQAQLDDAEVAGEVGRADAQDADQLVAHLLGELEQLGVGQLVQVGRRRRFAGAERSWRKSLIHWSP